MATEINEIDRIFLTIRKQNRYFRIVTAVWFVFVLSLAGAAQIYASRFDQAKVRIDRLEKDIFVLVGELESLKRALTEKDRILLSGLDKPGRIRYAVRLAMELSQGAAVTSEDKTFLRAIFEAERHGPDLDSIVIRAAEYLVKGNYKKAKEEFTTAAKSGNLANSLRADIYLGRAIAERKSGNHKSAVADYTKAIEIGPPTETMHAGRGLSYMFDGKLQEAINDFDITLQMNPTASVLGFRGLVHVLQGNYDKALVDFQQEVDSDARPKKRAGAMENIALVYLRQADWERALEITAEVDAIYDQKLWNALFKAIAADKLGDRDEAEAAHQRWTRKASPQAKAAMMVYLPEGLRDYIEKLP